MYRAREASPVQEPRLHEPSLQGEMAVQQVRGWCQALPRRDSRLSSVSELIFTILLNLFLLKHRQQRADATYMPVKSVQWTYVDDRQ